MTWAFITTLYPLAVFQSTPAEMQPDKIQLCTYKVHFVKRRKTSSKLCRRDDANIAVQSLLLNRLIVLLPAARTHFQTDLKQRRNFKGMSRLPSFFPSQRISSFCCHHSSFFPFFFSLHLTLLHSLQGTSSESSSVLWIKHSTTHPSVGHKHLLPIRRKKPTFSISTWTGEYTTLFWTEGKFLGCRDAMLPFNYIQCGRNCSSISSGWRLHGSVVS